MEQTPWVRGFTRFFFTKNHGNHVKICDLKMILDSAAVNLSVNFWSFTNVYWNSLNIDKFTNFSINFCYINLFQLKLVNGHKFTDFTTVNFGKSFEKYETKEDRHLCNCFNISRRGLNYKTFDGHNWFS